jgi:hypothetical protein
MVIQLLDPGEWYLKKGKKQRFRDMENREDIRLDVRQIEHEYHDKIKAYCDEINRECGENMIDHTLILTDRDCRTALAEFLRKRKRLW